MREGEEGREEIEEGINFIVLAWWRARKTGAIHVQGMWGRTV
jgi:hypothetical protein